MKDLIFHDACPGPKAMLGDFAAGLTAAMHKKRAKKINPGVSMTIAWQVAQSMHETEPECVLQLCTWHAAEAVVEGSNFPSKSPNPARTKVNPCAGATSYFGLA